MSNQQNTHETFRVEEFTYDVAKALAETFNRAAGAQVLTAVNPGRVLTVDALRKAFEAVGTGWVTTSTLFSLTYQQKPTHGEAILAGKWLSAQGLQRKKSGPTTLWLLDASVLQGAD